MFTKSKSRKFTRVLTITGYQLFTSRSYKCGAPLPYNKYPPKRSYSLPGVIAWKYSDCLSVWLLFRFYDSIHINRYKYTCIFLLASELTTQNLNGTLTPSIFELVLFFKLHLYLSLCWGTKWSHAHRTYDWNCSALVIVDIYIYNIVGCKPTEKL